MEHIKVFNDQDQGRLIFFDDDEVGKYAELENKICFIWDEKVFDVTNYQHKHPGGASILEDYSGYDISEVFFCYHKHSNYARDLMLQYDVGLIDDILYTQMSLNICNFFKFTIDKQKPIVSQIKKLNSEQYSYLMNGKFKKQELNLEKDKFYEKDDQEKRLWVNLLTTELIKIFASLSLLIHIKFNYNLQFLPVLISILLGYLLNYVESAIYDKLMFQIEPTNQKQREFLFLLYHYKNLFIISKQTTLITHLPMILLGFIYVIIFTLSGHYKHLVLYISFGQLAISASSDFKQQI